MIGVVHIRLLCGKEYSKGSSSVTYHDVPEHVGATLVALLTQVEAVRGKVAVINVTVLLHSATAQVL